MLRAARGGRTCLAFSDVLGDAAVIHVTHGKNTSVASAHTSLVLGGTIGSNDRFCDRLGSAHGLMARKVLDAVVEARTRPSEALSLLTQALASIPLPAAPRAVQLAAPPATLPASLPTQDGRARLGNVCAASKRSDQMLRELLPRISALLDRDSARSLTGLDAGTCASLQKLLGDRAALHDVLKSLGVTKLGGRLSLINTLQQLVERS